MWITNKQNKEFINTEELKQITSTDDLVCNTRTYYTIDFYYKNISDRYTYWQFLKREERDNVLTIVMKKVSSKTSLCEINDTDVLL